LVDNPVLEEYIVCSKGKSPGCSCGCEKRHWNTETDLGSHIVQRFADRGGNVVDHKSNVAESVKYSGGEAGVWSRVNGAGARLEEIYGDKYVIPVPENLACVEIS
jgi:hypothetical protein